MKLAKVSIRRPVFAFVMSATLLVFGLTSYGRVGVDLFPNVDFPFVTITAVYPGADPETIETKVVDKLEEAVNTVAGIDIMRSTSMENVGLVLIQFRLERDVDQAVQDVRDRVSSALINLPPDLEPPTIAKFDVGAAPVLQAVVSGPYPPRELTRIADDLVKAKLQTLPGVGGVDRVGGQKREFHVWLDPMRLDTYGLTSVEVIQALAGQNIEIPGGNVEVGDQQLTIKTRGQVHDRQGLEDLIITAMGGRAIRIGDVARVEDGVEERKSISTLNGVSAIGLVVRKQSGQNTVQVAHEIKAALEELRRQLPEGVEIAIPIDGSVFIEHSIKDVQFDLVFGAVLAVLIIMFFLRDWRATFISSLALPTSVIATFAFIDMMGFTFNVLTMLGLSLSIGILIDDAIVVIENIHRHLSLGKSPWKAAWEGTSEIGLAVMATTASIVAVFIPVAIMEGLIGRFFLQFGLTVAFAVTVSLFVAFTLTPMLSSRMLKPHDPDRKPFILSRAIERLLKGIETGYRFILRGALNHKVITSVLATGAFMSTFYLIKFVPMEFMPADDQGSFKVSVELPPGTNLDATESYVAHVTERIRQIPGVKTTFTTIGGGAQQEVNKADVAVVLLGSKERSFTQMDAMSYTRKALVGFKGANIAVEELPVVGGSSGMRQAIIQFNLRGGDYEELSAVADKLIAKLEEAGGYVDLDHTYRGGKPEVGVLPDRERAADLGVPMAMMAQTVRTFYAGAKATELATDGNRYDVRVRMDGAFRKDPKVIVDLKVRSTTGQLVALKDFATLDPGTGAAKIERQSRQRQVTVLANLDGKALGDAMPEIDRIAADLVPREMTTEWTGMGKMMTESVINMGRALLLAIILIYLILAAQFESLIHPLTIMISLPLSLVGAIGGLAAAGMALNMFSMIGIIMLMGLVTKNAILMVDYTNTLRDGGMDRFEALVEAGAVRLRPIIMTTAAMIFGMLPVALALAEGGEGRAPMAVAVIGGLITSTLLTLVVVPVVYWVLDSIAERLFGARRKRVGDDEMAEAQA